jgi:hypothetical protein
MANTSASAPRPFGKTRADGENPWYPIRSATLSLRKAPRANGKWAAGLAQEWEESAEYEVGVEFEAARKQVGDGNIPLKPEVTKGRIIDKLHDLQQLTGCM